MIQRFHRAKTHQDALMMQGGSDSRSSTPGNSLFGCEVSPMSSESVPVSSYSSDLSPTSPGISPGAQVVAMDHCFVDGKYVSSMAAGDTHRYMVEAYRNTPSEPHDQGRLVVEFNRAEQYRQMPTESHRVPSDLQRIRIDEQTFETYRNAPEDSYHNTPIDLQRVPEYSLRQDGEVASREVCDPIELSSAEQAHLLAVSYKEVSRQMSPPHLMQEPLIRTHAQPQRLVQESLLREYFSPTPRATNTFRPVVDERVNVDNIRYASPDSGRSNFERPENDMCLTGGTDSLGSEHLRVTPESVCMMPENLCLSEVNTGQLMPEVIGQEIDSVPVSNHEDILNVRLMSHPLELGMTPLRSHYQTNHHIMSETSLAFRDNIRAQSPQYVDSYHISVNHSGVVGQAALTPAPYVAPLPETPPRYYNSLPYRPSTPQSSHLLVQPHQFSNYIASDERDDYKTGALSVEERIERGYHDIKPFDQDYPVSMPVMHLSPECLASPALAKQCVKLKKAKEPKPPRTPIIHRCFQCERTFKNSTQLKNHMWRHTGEKPFTCEECGSKFTQQGNLRAHKRIHTGERPYHCTECKASFTQLSTLKTHQKIHSDERPYKCNECDAAFRQVANLKTHQVTHTGERPHKCDLCDKAFTQKSNLKAHKNRVHIAGHQAPGSVGGKRGRRKAPAPIKPFSCTECGSKFTIMSNLKIHMKLHVGERPFECDICNAGFSQRSNLKTHMDRMHGRVSNPPGTNAKRRIRCDECPAMFRLKRCLKTHKKKRHPIKSLKIKILRQSKLLTNNNSEEAAPDHILTQDDTDDEFDDYEEEQFSDDDTDVLPPSANPYPMDTSSLARPPHHLFMNKENLPTEPLVEIFETKIEPLESSPLGYGEQSVKNDMWSNRLDDVSGDSNQSNMFLCKSEAKSNDLPLVQPNCS